MVETCKKISNQQYNGSSPFVRSEEQFDALKRIKETITDKKMGEYLLFGIAFHNAGKLHLFLIFFKNNLLFLGLVYKDRLQIEDGFLKGHIAVICATSTLAVGVNLPAHLVIIKGTSQWNGMSGTQNEYSETEILQMIGRAGRPQFDNSATAVIMTSLDKKDFYENMLSGNQVIESTLHENLIEHLNAEIVLGSIKNVALALEWIKSSFLYGKTGRIILFIFMRNHSSSQKKSWILQTWEI